MHLLIVGGSRADRLRAALAEEHARHLRPSSRVSLVSRTIPFARIDRTPLPLACPRLIRIDDLEQACPNHQTAGLRLILTQTVYTMQKWLDRLAPDDDIIATADRAALEHNAPEALSQRGPWRTFDLLELSPSIASAPDPTDEHTRSLLDENELINTLSLAFTTADADTRVSLCHAAWSAA